MTINFRGGKMKRQEKNEIYSIRKFKVGVGSALIGLSFLGATGLVNDNFVTGDILGIHSVYADEATPKPEGNVIARGEDGVPWELYENGYLLFKPEAGKDTLTNGYYSDWNLSSGGNPTWKTTHAKQIKYIGFSNKVYAPTNSSYLFSRYSSNGDLNDYEFDPIAFDTTNLDTSNVTSMDFMFASLYSITSLDVTHFDTSKVNYMSGMFYDDANITSLNVTNFDTNKVQDMRHMFSGMLNITMLDLTHFDISAMIGVSGVSDIFSNMPKLKELKLGDKFRYYGIGTISPNHAYGNQYTDKWYKVNDKEHPYSVQDWAKLYKSDPSGTSGTWVREVTVQDATLEFEPGNGEKIQPLTFKASSTPTLPKPTVDKLGYKFKGWTLQDGSEVNLSSLPAGSRTTLVGKWEKVNNVTTRTVKIPVTTVYEGDSNLDKGKQTEIPGQEGEKRITTTSTVTPITGDLTNPVEKEEITQAMRPKVIKVGTKPTKEVETIPSPKQYVKDSEREKGQKDIVTEGTPGTKTTTTTYTVNPDNGEVTSHVGESVTVNPTPTIIKVAAKDKVETVIRDGKKFKVTTIYNVDSNTGEITEDRTEVELPKEEDPQDDAGVNGNNKLPDKVETIEPEVVYEKDATRDKGSENITIPGKDGQKVTPVTKEKDPQTGKLVDKLGEPKITPATNTIVKVAAKDKVETIRHNGDTIERTTRYTVNPETGEITEETTEQLISSNGNGVKPPVVENNDFSGGVSTEPLVNKTSDYKGVIAGNGLDNDGNAIKPPIATIPEFSGGVNGDVDGNALINEKPEFDLSTLKTPDLGTGLNYFGPKKETKKDDLQFIPVNEEKPSNDFKRSEKPVSQLPNTAGGNNMAINALGALTLASVLGFAVTKRKSEE